MAEDLDTAIIDRVEEVNKTTTDIVEKPADPDRSTADKSQAQNKHSRRSREGGKSRNM